MPFAGSYACSVCGKKIEQDVFGDAQKHLTRHIGVYAELIREDSFQVYFKGIKGRLSEKGD